MSEAEELTDEELNTILNYNKEDSLVCRITKSKQPSTTKLSINSLDSSETFTPTGTPFSHGFPSHKCPSCERRIPKREQITIYDDSGNPESFIRCPNCGFIFKVKEK